MTKKRFYIAESNLIEGYCVFDREKKYAFHPRPRKADCLNDAHILNELHEENEQLQSEVNKLTDLLASEIEKNARLLQENNSLKIENMRLREEIKDLNDVLARYEEKELNE